MARLTLYPRGKTFWVSGTINGIRIRESTGSTNKAKAQRWAARREWELEQEAVFGAKSVFTFGAAMNLYIEGGGEQRFLLPLLDAWEDRKMIDIHPGDVVDIANRLYPNASGATKNRQAITPILAIFRHAAARGKCAPILVPRFETKRIVKRKTATWEWVEKLTERTRPNLTALVLLVATTGARIGDAVKLEWRNVNLEEGSALLLDTKNGEDRLVELLPEVRAALQGLHRRHKRVFGYETPRGVYRALATACAAAGIEYIPSHGFGRRLFATSMNAAGVDPKTAATAGGWKSVRMYIDVYAQPANTGEAVRRAIGTKLTQSTKPKARKA